MAEPIYMDAPNGQKDPPDPKKIDLSFFIQLLTWIVFLMIFLFVILNFRIVIASGPSMEPTYTQGDAVLCVRRSSEPEADDVVLFEKDGTLLLKRVYLASGDTVSADPIAQSCWLGGLYSVPEGYVFVVGDNPEESWDSRSEDFGLVPIADIWGYAIATVIDK